MTRLSKEDAIKTIQNRRAQVEAILRQAIPTSDLSRTLRNTFDRTMLCCDLSDTELSLLSADYLNDILDNGWWSEVGRAHLRRMLEAARRTRPF
ncbi:MAG: hypothetical protein HYV36_02455 [Lentisphaerae bacterium]|nr:hypothetical protein [Lentisphaerota bacterium]